RRPGAAERNRHIVGSQPLAAASPTPHAPTTAAAATAASRAWITDQSGLVTVCLRLGAAPASHVLVRRYGRTLTNPTTLRRLPAASVAVISRRTTTRRPGRIAPRAAARAALVRLSRPPASAPAVRLT